MMTHEEKKQQYNRIMEDISKTVKGILNRCEKSRVQALNESEKKSLDTEKAAKAIADACKKTSTKQSKFNILSQDYKKIKKDEYGTNTFVICGGLNGPGKWTDYFRDLAKFVDEISKKYHVWLIKAENDCMDDIFYFTFGIS